MLRIIYQGTPPILPVKLVSVFAMAAALGMSTLFTDLTALFVLQNSLLMVGVAPIYLFGLFNPNMHSGVPLAACLTGTIIALALAFSAEGPALTLANPIGLAVVVLVASVLDLAEKTYVSRI